MIDPQVYKFDGQTVHSDSFKFVKPTFSESYDWAVKKFADLDFLKVIGEDGKFIERTFAQFARDVDAVGNYLSKELPRVLITVDGNTYENLVYMTAGLLGGCTVSPMNPLEGADRIRQKQLQIGWDSRIYAGSAWHKGLEPLGARLMDIPALVDQKPAVSKPKKRSSDEPMILIFTSGSTGYSKIVMQPEMAVLSNVDALIELHGFDQARKVIATPLPVFHVNALEFSFFCSLFSGQRLVVFERFQFFQVLESLEHDKVQIFSAIPSVLKTFADLPAKVRTAGSHLQYCVTAAASLSPDLARLLAESFPFKIIQGYGLSEAVNFSLKIPPVMAKEKVDFWLTNWDRPSAGTPLRGNDVFILRPDGSLATEGEVGEICIRGHNVMIGYKDQNPETTFAGGYLHTGDLGFFHFCKDTGRPYFFISSRIKDVIKRFGQTVSMVEIDEILQKACPAGTTAISVPFPNKYSGEELGVVCNTPESDEVLEKIRDHLIQALPAYLRPRAIARSEQKLTTESGKPRRWVFIPLFESQAQVSFGEVPVIISKTVK